MYGVGQQTVMGSVSGAALGAANGYVPAPAPSQEIPSAMERLQQTVESMLYQIDGLDNRLTGVVARPQGPMPEEKTAARAVMNTGIGAQLDSMNDRLRQANTRLSGLLDRLEF